VKASRYFEDFHLMAMNNSTRLAVLAFAAE